MIKYYPPALFVNESGEDHFFTASLNYSSNATGCNIFGYITLEQLIIDIVIAFLIAGLVYLLCELDNGFR